MKLLRILFVDDDAPLLESLIRGLTIQKFNAEAVAAQNAVRAIELLRQHQPEVAVIDLSLNRHEGVEAGFRLLQEILRESPSCRVIVLTGNSGTEFGVRAISLGAAHFISKPVDLTHLRALIRDSLEQAHLRRSLSRYQSERQHELSSSFVGKSGAAEKLRQDIFYAAGTAQAVFIRGETGTGKGLCAQLIHQMSEHRQKPFIRYQPIFGSSDLANSDLFGHRRGAFTGAEEDRRGLLSLAHGGTLFLDEVDELPRELQIGLLGVLHDRSYRPLGDNKIQQAEFRLISASNASLEKKIDEGKFRRDLFHRIAHFQILIPPLRDRVEDIEELTLHQLTLIKNRRQTCVYGISEKALALLQSCSWPGNIRQLESVIESAVWRAQHRNSLRIEEEDLSLSSENQTVSHADLSFHQQLQALEAKLVGDALCRFGGSFSAAARTLGIDRGTVKRIAERASALPDRQFD